MGRVPAWVLLALAWAGCAAPPAAGPPSPWRRLGPPAEGEWRQVHPEKERSVGGFRRTWSDRPRPGSEARLYVQPLGHVLDARPELFSLLSDFLERFFLREVVVLPSRPVPIEAYHPDRHQYDAAVILAELCVRVPGDACALLGLLERDLFHGDYSFLYGLGSLRRGVGVCSVARYGLRYIGMDEDVTLEKRALKVAAHEMAHALGLRHCSTFPCLLNGSNSIVEADRSPLHLCPSCRAKLAWLLGWDVDERYRGLEAFYESREGFAREAAFVRAVLRYRSGGTERQGREGREGSARSGPRPAPSGRPLSRPGRARACAGSAVPARTSGSRPGA